MTWRDLSAEVAELFADCLDGGRRDSALEVAAARRRARAVERNREYRRAHPETIRRQRRNPAARAARKRYHARHRERINREARERYKIAAARTRPT